MLTGWSRIRWALANLADYIALELHWYKDNLAVCALRHLLKRLELTDLHSCGGGENIGSLTHEACRVDLGAGRNNFGLSKPLLLGGRRKRSRYLRREEDILGIRMQKLAARYDGTEVVVVEANLDENALDRNTPLICNVTDNFGDLERDRFALGDDALYCTRTNDMPESGLRPLDESLSEISDTEGCAVWVGDLEVDDRVATQTS